MINTSYKSILRLAAPMALSMLMQNIVFLVDTAFVSRLGESELGGVGLGSLLYIVFFFIGYGFNAGMQVIVGRRNGEGRLAEIGTTFDRNLILLIPLSLILWSTLQFLSPLVMPHLVDSPEVLSNTLEFNQWRCNGIFFGLFNSAVNAYFIGVGNTRPVGYSTIVLAATNIFLDWILIFGHFGFEAMGVKGAAIATMLAEVAATIFNLIYIFQMGYRKKFSLFHFRKPEDGFTKKLLALSAPIMAQQVIAFAAWFSFFLFIENLGKHALAISNILRSLYFICAIPVWALGSATNSTISNLLGKGRSEEVIRFVWKVAWLCFGIVAAIFLTLMIFHPWVMLVYTNDPRIIADSFAPFLTVGVALAGAAFAVIFLQTITATGSTGFILLSEIVSIIIYIAYALLVTKVIHASLAIIWGTEVIYWISIFTIMLLFLYRGNWAKKKL